jgi:hypothetical protein
MSTDLETAARLAERARLLIQQRDEAIVIAWNSHSLREIGAAVGLSHTGVRRVVERMTK